jgi:hypothetical protein
VLFAFPAYAGGAIYLNGVRIDGVTNQKFEKVSVRIDDAGDVHIDAPGYSVRQLEPAPSAPTPAPLSKKYFLVAEQSAAGMPEYDIDVYVNSKWLKKLKSTDSQVVQEISSNLVRGTNTILFVAKKQPNQSRKSYSKTHYYRVTVGEGQASGDQVVIDRPSVKFERTANETNDVTQEFTLTAR